MIHVTNQRLCLQGRLGWVDIGFGDIRAFDALPDGVVVHRQGHSPVKIAMPAVAYLYVLLSYLASGQVISVPLPADFTERARRAGRDVPVQERGTTSGFGAGPWHAAGAMPSAPWPAPEALYSSDGAVAWNPPARPGPKTDVLGRPYADWGTRAVAHVIDALVIICGWAVLLAAVVAGTKLRTAPAQFGATSTSGAGVAIIVVSLLGLVAFTLGYHLLHGGESGQTPRQTRRGRSGCETGIRTGGPISYGPAFGRYLAEVFAYG